MLNKTGERRELEKNTAEQTLRPFEDMDRMFERMFEDFFPRGWLRPFHFRRGWLPEVPFEGLEPRIDMVDHDDRILVRAELPGVEKDALHVSLTADAVTIKTQSRQEDKEEGGHYYRHEIFRGAFARTLSLPCPVRGDKAKAQFKDGVLELTLPKVQMSKRQTIKVE